MEEKTLSIKMFGGFEVTYGGETVIGRDSRNSKVLQLFQYLLVNRGRMVQQEELINVLLGNEECENPVGVLKNLVYRLRKLLEGAGMPRECIRYKKSAYGFCMEFPYKIDEEEFSDYARRVAETEGEEGLALCFSAIDLYRGGFLPKSTGEPWIMGYSVQYQEAYCDCLRQAYRIAEQIGRHDELVVRLQKAASLYPYEEDLSLMYIDCLYREKRVKEALEAYETVSALLLNDLGIEPTPRMKELYQRITGGMQEAAQSVLDVRSRMVEEEYKKGAFYCNFEVFTNLYRFVVRHMERSGQSVFLTLCTLSELDGRPPESGERTQKAVDSFHVAVEKSLRRGDAYTRYSPSQFVIMLMEIKQENCNIVADRLRQHFYREPKMNQMRLNCKSISAADMDVLMDRFQDEGPAAW